MRVVVIEAAQCYARACDFRVVERGLSDLLDYAALLGLPSLRLGFEFQNGDMLLVEQEARATADRFRFRLRERQGRERARYSAWFTHAGLIVGRPGPTLFASAASQLRTLNDMLEFDWSGRTAGR